ncbi:ftsH [Symbiodinium natans]|uniref:FtsH protein n=1 Tax=Symbiodinium natans TaxID=878477 RepID=A0A812PZB4_9DINO|nr:ftsH [Symbiodinium natans]
MVKNAWSADPGGHSADLRFFSRSYDPRQELVEAEEAPKQPLHEDGFPLRIKLEQKKVPPSVLMGQCRRSPLTGEVILHVDPAYPNFQVVDLAGRDWLPRNRLFLEKDEYLFRPVPLMYRTWLYQSFFLNPSGLGKASDLDYVVRQALDAWCMDILIWDHRWSPVMAYAFIMFLSSLTLDGTIIAMACAIGLLTCAFAVSCNTARIYQRERWLSLPFRFAFLCYILIFFPMATVLEAIGSTLLFLLVSTEIILGDCYFFPSYRFHCRYNILRSLGCRVYVCERDGAVGMPAVVSRTPDKMPHQIVQLPKWTTQNHLIVELEGLMVELRPMRKEDWSKAAQEFGETQDPITFVSLPLCEYDGPEMQDSSDGEEDHLPKKMARGAVRGSTHLETLRAFRQAREIYGGNEQLDWMIQAKLHLIGIHPLKSLVGLLPHHELIFDRSLTDGSSEPAFANLRHIEDATDPAAVSPVHGVVHAISQKELASLDSSEAPLYERVQMPVQVNTSDGPQEVQAWTYVGHGGSTQEHEEPLHANEGRFWACPGFGC